MHHSCALTKLVVLLLAIAFSACMTYEAVPNADWPVIESGDQLRVTTRAGEIHELEVQDVDGETVRGSELELGFADIALIERYQPMLEPHKWVLIGAALAFAAYGIATYELG
jgi:hypothetical protein